MYLFIYVSWLKKQKKKHEFWLFALLFILLFFYTNIPTQTCWDEFLGPKEEEKMTEDARDMNL